MKMDIFACFCIKIITPKMIFYSYGSNRNIFIKKGVSIISKITPK